MIAVWRTAGNRVLSPKTGLKIALREGPMLRLAVLLSMVPASLAGDDAVETQAVDPELMHVVHLTWARDKADAVLPQLLVNGNADVDVDVVLTFRASFADKLTTWTMDPIPVDADTSEEVSIKIPSEAHWATEQDNYFTDLEISVQTYDTKGRLIGTNSGPRLKMYWKDSSFVLLDIPQAQALAPHGYIREAPAGAAELLSEEGSDHVEFGPGL
jgi:hypothetical protein